jgi:hypothetical protein
MLAGQVMPRELLHIHTYFSVMTVSTRATCQEFRHVGQLQENSLTYEILRFSRREMENNLING